MALKRRTGPPLHFYASQRFELISDPRPGFEGEYKARTLEYIYEVRVDPDCIDEADQVDLLGWHWHPRTTPDRTAPHMHVRAAYQPLGTTLGKLHLPTGRVAFEEVILCLFNELDVLPVRDDWEQVLEETYLRFRTYRTWT